MFLSLYQLAFQEARALKIYDSYFCHRLVYGLFPDVATHQAGRSILYVDKGIKNRRRQLLILSGKRPRTPEVGKLETRTIPDSWFQFPSYRFEIVINPVRRISHSRRIEPIRGRNEISEWFLAKAPSWGFKVNEDSLQIGEIWVDSFMKNGIFVTIGKADAQGRLEVIDREKFVQSACQGIGRGRAFGCGLLQIVPASCQEIL